MGSFSDSIHSINSVFITLKLFYYLFLHLPHFVDSSLVLPSFYSDFSLSGSLRLFILLFKFSIYALNETPRILALLMFPMGIF